MRLPRRGHRRPEKKPDVWLFRLIQVGGSKRVKVIRKASKSRKMCRKREN